VTKHSVAIVALLLYVTSLGFRLATPIEKKPWTLERKTASALQLAVNVFVIWLFVLVLT